MKYIDLPLGRFKYSDAAKLIGISVETLTLRADKLGWKISDIMRPVSSRKKLERHGLLYHPLYSIYSGIRQRCLDSNYPSYHNYGGRGITMCQEWLNSFQTFFDDMIPTWSDGLTIDRINNDLGYYADNCKWSTTKEQCNNTRFNRIINTPDGRMNVSQAAEKYDLNCKTIYSRLHRGCSDADLLKPIKRK